MFNLAWAISLHLLKSTVIALTWFFSVQSCLLVICLVAIWINYKDAACFTCCSTLLKRCGCEAADAALSQPAPAFFSRLLPLPSITIQLSFLNPFVICTFLHPLKCLVFSLLLKILVRSQLGKVRTILPACGLFKSYWDQLRRFIEVPLLYYSTGDSPAAKLLVLPLSEPLRVSVLNLSPSPLYTFLFFLSFRLYSMAIRPACYV